MRDLRRWLVGALGAVLLLGSAASGASAHPPANDNFDQAQPVIGLPVRLTANTADATSQASAEEGLGFPCLGVHTVWYVYRPSTTATVRVVTLGSDFDTMLGIFTGTAGALQPLTCSNDTRFDDSSAAVFQFNAAQAYYIALSSCCSTVGGSDGGKGVIRFYLPRALQYRAGITAGRAGDASGRAFVSGTLRCTNPSHAALLVAVSQRVDRWVARGASTISLNCTHTTRRWSVAIDSDTAVAFVPGRAAVTVSGQADDGFAVLTRESTRVLMLTKAPAAPR